MGMEMTKMLRSIAGWGVHEAIFKQYSSDFLEQDIFSSLSLISLIGDGKLAEVFVQKFCGRFSIDYNPSDRNSIAA